MPSRSSPTARLAARAALVLSLAAVGCGGPSTTTNQRPPRAAEGIIKPVDVSDDDFAAALASVLKDGSRTPERLALLSGVVKRQLAHAERRFALGQSERGTGSVMGGFYLVRVGEGQGAMIDETGAKALDGAIRHLSTRGDEGRVYALMRMRAAALGDKNPARAELDDHAANLDRWLNETHAGGPGRRLGSEARYLVARAMVEPSEETLKLAGDAVEGWIARAIEVRRILRTTNRLPERAEVMEARRAIDTGAATLAALYIRHGDAQAALQRIDNSEARLVAGNILRRTLIAAAEDGDARAWEMLAAVFAHEGAPTEEEEDPADKLDPMLVEAGLWGSVLEAYRKEPTNFGMAALLAEQLTRLGLSEGAPAVLVGALGTNPSPRFIGAATRIVFEAMAADADAGDVDAVHRTFRAAAPILAAADRPEMLAAGIEPSPSRLRLLMASVELRAGDLASARPLYEAAAKADPSVAAWVHVARADRQAGDKAAAIESLRRALASPDAKFSVADVCEAYLVAFEVHRDAGAVDSAKNALEDALAAALTALKQRGDANARARAETLLARVLDAYGESKAARRANERALAAVASDRPALGATVLQVVSRALVRRDLESARAALRQGLDADVGQEERIYGGLWVLLLERSLGVPTDESTTRALAISGDRDAWVVKLAQWALGRMTDEALLGAAQNAAQRVEAEFYTAMARKAAGDAAAEARLRRVAESPNLDLVEVQMARDLLAPSFRAELPRGVAVP